MNKVDSFRVKICGLKSVKDALAAVDCGADAIGLNFYSKSLRSVDEERAKSIANELPDDIVRIGVFVNMQMDQVCRIAESIPLHAVQLHGDETADWIQDWPLSLPVIRAVRVVNQNFEDARLEVDRWIRAGAAFPLLDAGSSTAYGGTGRQLDWEQVARHFDCDRLVLAGGLNCDNVSQAIRMCRPRAIDVASGVEKFPGAKDRQAMKHLISKAIQAFNS